LAAEQARLTALDARRGELEAERSVYESFLAKVNTSNDSLRLEASRDLSYTPELAADPVVNRMSQQVLVYQTRLDSLTTGPLPAAPTNPDVLGLNALIQSTQEQLVRAVRAHLTSIAAQSRALAALRSRTGASFQPPPATETATMRRERLVEYLRGSGTRTRHARDKGLGAEVFRLVYSALTFGWGEGGRTILVTSAAPREGKTLIAENLGVTFAREGVRVLVVDCDLRRPRLHRVFGVAPAPGLIELLKSNGATLAQSPDAPLGGAEATVAQSIAGIRHTKIAGLSLLPCGALTPRAHELLKPQRIRGL